MAKYKKDGSYDLRTKAGREAKSMDESIQIWGNVFRGLFNLVFLLIALPFRFIAWIFGRR